MTRFLMALMMVTMVGCTHNPCANKKIFINFGNGNYMCADSLKDLEAK